MEEKRFQTWLESLTLATHPLVWNPWRDYDERYDKSPEAPKQRLQQLESYLRPRLGKAKYVVVAEAMGYQGGHFSGIAMTCERMLLGHHPAVLPEEIIPDAWFGKGDALRTSNPNSPYIEQRTQRELGFNEPTDTVVWSAIKENELHPNDVLLWNIFPFHPYQEGQLLTNRTPTDEELLWGWQFTEILLSIHGKSLIFAVGKKAQQVLQSFGKEAIGLRHPANGGATAYKEGFKQALK